MPLIPFAPGVDACGTLVVPPPNAALILAGGAAAADSEAAGFEALNLAFDDGAAPWRSGPLGSTVTVTMTFPATLVDFVALVGTNIQLNAATPAGYEFTGLLSAGIVVGPLADLDPLVRVDDSALPPLAAALLEENLSIVPLRFAAPAVIDEARWVFDVSGGNGGPNFLQAAYAVVGTVVGLRTSLPKGNQVNGTSLSDQVFTAGARGFEIARTPQRSQAFNPPFLDEDQDALLAEWSMSKLRASKGLVWRTPTLLDTFSRDAFFGLLSPKVPRAQISGQIYKSAATLLESR